MKHEPEILTFNLDEFLFPMFLKAEYHYYHSDGHREEPSETREMFKIISVELFDNDITEIFNTELMWEWDELVEHISFRTIKAIKGYKFLLRQVEAFKAIQQTENEPDE